MLRSIPYIFRMTDLTVQGEERRTGLSARRGAMMKCPNCGDAKLFRKYLKQVRACSKCGEDWEAIRADDGPAWLTMLIVGHLIAPFVIEVVRNDGIPLWVGMFGIPVLAGALCLLLLQPIKGLWMGIIWANRVPTS